MKGKKFNLCVYYIGVGLGLLSGLCFSRAQYHKGKRDAYLEQMNFLEELANGIEKTIYNLEEK